ncbi:hypothetical protein MUO65_07900, partial [bacterium]|nr:hypothetical protein [bacterium]
VDKMFIGYLMLFTLLFVIIFAQLLAWNLLDLFLIASTLMALLVSGGLILKNILSSPLRDWNGIRLAWTFSLLHGYQLYYPADSGPVLSLLAGPLQPLTYLPAALINSPTPALILASFISACYYFLPILCLHIGKDLTHPRELSFGVCAFACFCLFTLSSRALTYSAFAVYADAPALGYSAIACAILYYRKRKDNIIGLLLAALFSVFAVWTKQTLVPLLFALPTYILLTDGYRCFKRYILCLSVSGVVVSALFLCIFNAENLLFNMLTVPIRTPCQFSENRIVALFTATYDLIKESFLFAAILIFYSVYQLSASSNVPNKLKAWLGSNQWTMLAIVSLFMVPTSVLGRVRVGGDVNTLSPTVYFLVAAVTLALKRFASDSLSSFPRPGQGLAQPLLVLLITGLVYINIPNFFSIQGVLKNLSGNEQKVAYEYAKNHPREVYFPNNPLSSLLAEGKLYHHAYGLFDREQSGFPVSREHFLAHIPPNIRLVAFQSYGGSMGKYVLNYLPEFSKQVTIDELPGWIVYMRE